MGTWGTAIKDSDAFADIYSEFFDLYNKGGQPDIISKKIVDDKWEILEIEEEKNSLWFALALAQWETKSLDPKVLSTVEEIIISDADLKIWLDLGASEQYIKKRKIALEKFLEKIKSDRPKVKPRKREKLKTPIFAIGDCLVFKLTNGNYGGAVVLATDNNPETGYNLVATTRLNQNNKPTLKDFENAEVLICNFGQWKDKVDVTWYMPDLFYKDYADSYEINGNITVELEYEIKNYDGKGYLFKPSWTSGWSMNYSAERQFESELTKPKPSKILTIKQLTKKVKWLKVF
ncbi:hypothetical protein [Pedobacter jejuensis]|uniref:DUF4259 domain-containing protein n=1 Tax=Pedobacter jejuensis TaxID=1268550 RepID=A0A3N0BX19_9SPHI|nr:hypothetical protein [Pedobacter jejuensis]RNL54221.1 hypothetical protein D7004_09015 [Pedobacter jejuensis]